MTKIDGEKVAALVVDCLWPALYCLLCLPAWYVLMYTVLESIQAPTYCWVIFWAYVPCSFLAAIVSGVAKAILE